MPVGRWEDGWWGVGVGHRGFWLCGSELTARVGLCADSGHHGVPCSACRHRGCRFLLTREVSSQLAKRARPSPSLAELGTSPANRYELGSDCWTLSDGDVQAVGVGDKVGVSWQVPNPHGSLVPLLRSEKLINPRRRKGVWCAGSPASFPLSAIPVFPVFLLPSQLILPSSHLLESLADMWPPDWR